MRLPSILLASALLATVAEAAPKARKGKAPEAPPKAAAKVTEAPPEEAAPKEVARKPPPPAISEEDFQSVLESIQDAGSYSSSKLSALQLAADGKGFKMEQVGKLVDLFSFSEDKLKVVKALKPAIVDPANSAALLAHFSFATDKEAAQKVLND